jgi:purine-binding chemotaxis protein CheW
VDHLRREFDRAFAEPAHEANDDFEDLLALRVGGGAYAARLVEIRGIHTQKKIVALPSRCAELLGVVGLREGIMPVYSLRLLLGYAREERPSRWMLLAGHAEPVVLSFDTLEGYVRARKNEVASTTRIKGELYTVLNMSALIASIKARIEEG